MTARYATPMSWIRSVTPWHEEWEEVRGMFEAALMPVV
jgi:hypothetical protein